MITRAATTRMIAATVPPEPPPLEELATESVWAMAGARYGVLKPAAWAWRSFLRALLSWLVSR